MHGRDATEGETHTQEFAFLLCVCLYVRGCSVFLCRLEWFESVQAERLPSAPSAPTAAVRAELSRVLLAVGLQQEDPLLVRTAAADKCPTCHCGGL